MPTDLCNSDDAPTVGEIFQLHAAEHPVKAVARALRMKLPTAYRIFSGGREKWFRVVADCIRFLPAPIADDLMCYLVRGSNYRVHRVAVAPAGADPIEAMLVVDHDLHELFVGLHHGIKHGHIDPTRLADLVSKANRAERDLEAVRSSIEGAAAAAAAVAGPAGRLNGHARVNGGAR